MLLGNQLIFCWKGVKSVADTCVYQPECADLFLLLEYSESAPLPHSYIICYYSITMFAANTPWREIIFFFTLGIHFFETVKLRKEWKNIYTYRKSDFPILGSTQFYITTNWDMENIMFRHNTRSLGIFLYF